MKSTRSIFVMTALTMGAIQLIATSGFAQCERYYCSAYCNYSTRDKDVEGFDGLLLSSNERSLDEAWFQLRLKCNPETIQKKRWWEKEVLRTHLYTGYDRATPHNSCQETTIGCDD